MAPSIPQLDLDRLALQAADRRVLHAARNETKAIVSLVEWPPASDEAVVVKDLSSRAPWFRALVGRPLLSREWKALEFLAGTQGAPVAGVPVAGVPVAGVPVAGVPVAGVPVAGVPAPVARVDADAFAMKWCAGESFLRFAPGEVPASAVAALEQIVVQMHARGVTHGDLHRDNILLDEKGQVSVIDWATACVFGPYRRGLKAWTWREWQALDLRALAKIKARYAPELLRPDERLLLEQGGSFLSHFVRRVGTLFKRRTATIERREAGEGGLSQHI